MMDPFPNLGRIFIYVGIGFVILGGLLTFSNPFWWFGRLPGDILIDREQFTVFMPLASCLVISVLLSLLLYFVGRF